MAMAVGVPRYTVADLERFPDDGNRYELLDGVLLVSPGPGQAHQLVTSRICAPLMNALMLSGRANVVSPGAVVQMPRTRLEPDILVFPNRYSAKADWADVDEQWLAVEVLSR